MTNPKTNASIINSLKGLAIDEDILKINGGFVLIYPKDALAISIDLEHYHALIQEKTDSA